MLIKYYKKKDRKYFDISFFRKQKKQGLFFNLFYEVIGIFILKDIKL